MGVFPGFLGPSYESQTPVAGAERCVNWYPEALESGMKGRVALYPTPGVQSFATLGDTPIRGLFAQQGRCFAVAGGTLYEINEAGTPTNLGAVLEDGNPATFTTNGDQGGQLAISSGDLVYVLRLSDNTLTQPVSDASHVAFLDGYVLKLDPATSKVNISALNDANAWDATEFLQRTAGSDRLRSLLVADRDVWLFGERTSEVWWNQGTSPFPFAPAEEGFIEEGTAAPFSPALLNKTPVWLGQNQDGARIVWRASGYQPVRISTHAIEHALASYERVDDAVGFTYQQRGHNFYVLNLPDAGATWAYDAATQLWHERGTWRSDRVRFDAWHPQSHCYVFNKHLVGDRMSGTVFELDVDLYNDTNGKPIHRIRQAPHINNEHRQVFHRSLELEFGRGLGAIAGQGVDPQFMLQWSNDGGQTWGNEHWRGAGPQGQYGRRAIWRRLGGGRDRVYRLAVSDPIFWPLVGAYLDVETGAS